MKKRVSLEEHFGVYKSAKKEVKKEFSSSKTKRKIQKPIKKKIKKEEKKVKRDIWMLPAAFILPFLFFIPFSVVAGLVFSIKSYKNSRKKLYPLIAIILNIVLFYFNFLWTTIFIDVFIFGNG